ncbi:MAG TPA: Wzy polymerase domain-containing protein, partial [Burkholderiaceae bacterium]
MSKTSPSFGPLAEVLLFVTLLAVAVPPLIAYSRTPSSTLYNQLAALGGSGLLLMVLAPYMRAARGLPAGVWALLVLTAAMLASPFWTELPLSLALCNSGMTAAALALMLAGARLDAAARSQAFEALAWALLLAGAASVGVCLVQVFAPDLVNSNAIAHSGVPGRAVGNMRQPNHLASLLLWGAIAATYLAQRRRLPLAVFGVLIFGFMLSLVMAASRTGYIGIGLLVLWGLLDRQLGRGVRALLVAAPLMFFAAYELMAAWAHAGGHAFGAESRMSEGAGSPARVAILRNAWTLVTMHPWTGVGWGEFNLAWTMTPFPDRPIAFFDHTHNLPMQLLVELGAPLALLVMGLMSWSFWRLSRAAWLASDERATLLRSAFMLVLMIGLHSIFEYPLWYAYFLLPAAYAFGLGLGSEEGAARPAPLLRPLAGVAGAVIVLSSVAAYFDYQRIVVIYAPPEKAAPLMARIADG